MRHPAAGIVVLAMLAAGLPVYAQRAVVRGSRPVRLNLQEIAKWQAILRIEDARDPTAADISLLVAVARRADPPPDPKASLNLHHHAVRALGRFERLELVPTLRGFLQHSEIRGTAELALLTTLRAHASTTSPHHLVVETVNDLIAMPASPVVLGNLPINFPDQFAAAEERLRAVLNDPKGPREAAARGLEALARRNRRIGRLRDETVELLKKGATWRLPEMQPTVDEPIVFHSMAAVLSAAMMDEELVGASFRELNPEIRRLGALALYGSGSTLDADRRTELIAQALKDRAASVRLEGLPGVGSMERAKRRLRPDRRRTLRCSRRHRPGRNRRARRVVPGRRGDHGTAGERGPDAAERWPVAPGNARARGAGETRAGSRRQRDAVVLAPSDLAGPDVRGACGSRAERHRDAESSGL